jgi:hypothetical protein
LIERKIKPENEEINCTQKFHKDEEIPTIYFQQFMQVPLNYYMGGKYKLNKQVSTMINIP